MSKTYRTCPICDHEPVSGDYEEFDICIHCGIEFAYDDARRSHEELRAAYESAGRPVWNHDGCAPWLLIP